MISTTRIGAAAIVIVCAIATAQAQQVLSTRYTVSLYQQNEHVINVQMELGPGLDERQLQLPVWNALYQVRDFSQYVSWVKASESGGVPLKVQKIDKSRWRVSGAVNGAKIEYQVYADVSGPYSAQFNAHHAFLNLADVLMYATDLRSAPMSVRFSDLPAGWKIATPLGECASGQFCAENYDLLVDSPFEVGTFREKSFEEGGARYRVIVDADPGDYDMDAMVKTLQSIVRSATAWMRDRPYETYVFTYHFPRGPGGGGMEHAYGTAIEISAATMKDNPAWFAEISAHEFFHLWNVKRIRPQGLEPIDYTKENYTRALWFSEGVTSTVADYIQLRAGLLDERSYLDQLGEQITTLQTRPAHRTQSAEEASLDAWLEKYNYYRQPKRSISYYNKGELLGVLLDLSIRQASGGTVSLRDLFWEMNQEYGHSRRAFDDSKGVRDAAEHICRCELKAFFERYVGGTEEIPWDGFFSTVGLRVASTIVEVGDPGLEAQRVFGGTTVITDVIPDGNADRAGVRTGDALLEINGKNAGPNAQQLLERMHAGETVKLRLRRGAEEREVKFKIGSKTEIEYAVREMENVTPQQRSRRTDWLGVESRGALRH